MTIAVDDILRAVVTIDLDGISKAQNVFHLKHQSGTSKTDDEVLVAIDEWVTSLYGALASITSDLVSMTKTELFVRGTGVWEPVGVVTPTFAGGLGTNRVPSGVALLLKQFKARTGHSDKKFISGLTEDYLNGDTWGSTVITAGDAFNVIWAAQYVGTASVTLRAGSYSTITTNFRQYVSARSEAKPSYQRRRRPGVGLT